MDIAATISQILTAHEGRGVRPKKMDLSRWHVAELGIFSSRRGRQNVKACKLELMTTIATSDKVIFIRHAELPIDYELPGDWQQVSEYTFILPTDFDPQEKNNQYWLDIGGWMLYLTNNNEPIPASFWQNKSTDPRLGHNVAFMIDAFWDNLEWTITFGSESNY